MAQQQAESAQEEAQLAQETAQKTAMLLKEEHEAGQAARAASPLLQQDVNKHIEEYNQLEVKCDTLVEDLRK